MLVLWCFLVFSQGSLSCFSFTFILLWFCQQASALLHRLNFVKIVVFVGYPKNNVKAKDVVLTPVCEVSLGAFMGKRKVCLAFHTLFKCIPPYLLGFSRNFSGFLTQFNYGSVYRSVSCNRFQTSKLWFSWNIHQ